MRITLEKPSSRNYKDYYVQKFTDQICKLNSIIKQTKDPEIIAYYLKDIQYYEKEINRIK